MWRGMLCARSPSDKPDPRSDEFDIETTYRLRGQARATTRSHSPAVRLPYVGVALLLQNEWVILKLQYANEGRQGSSGFIVREELRRIALLLEMLVSAMVRRLGAIRLVHHPGRFRRRPRAMGIPPR
jgi:hypothetical protein